MPLYVISKTVEALNSHRKPLNGSRALVLGLAYKANVDDMRESPAFHLLDLLQARGAQVAYYDPHIPIIGPTREHGNWQGLKSIPWNQESIASFDVVLICAAHDAVNYMNWPSGLSASWIRETPCTVFPSARGRSGRHSEDKKSADQFPGPRCML